MCSWAYLLKNNQVYIAIFKIYDFEYDIINMMSAKYDGDQHRFVSIVYNFLKKPSNTHKETGIIFENQHLAWELHKPIIRKFEKQMTFNRNGQFHDFSHLFKWTR